MLTLKIEEDGYESNLQPLDIFHACWLLISHSLLSLLGNCAILEMFVLCTTWHQKSANSSVWPNINTCHSIPSQP